MTQTKATGGIESDARTGNYFGHGQDYFQLYQDVTKTNIYETKTKGPNQLHQYGIKTNIDEAKTKGPNQLHQDRIKTNIDEAKNKATDQDGDETDGHLARTKKEAKRPGEGRGDEERAGAVNGCY